MALSGWFEQVVAMKWRVNGDTTSVPVAGAITVMLGFGAVTVVVAGAEIAKLASSADDNKMLFAKFMGPSYIRKRILPDHAELCLIVCLVLRRFLPVGKDSLASVRTEVVPRYDF
jgi:hypothetical protein